MFSNRKSQSSSGEIKDSKVDTLIGTTTNITGNINSDGNIRVDGRFNGDIISKKEVTIGEAGVVVGNITAENVVISGMVNGNIKCDGLLEILPSGKLYGDFEVNCVSIEEGAVFKGKSVMRDKNEDNAEENEAQYEKNNYEKNNEV